MGRAGYFASKARALCVGLALSLLLRILSEYYVTRSVQSPAALGALEISDAPRNSRPVALLRPAAPAPVVHVTSSPPKASPSAGSKVAASAASTSIDVRSSFAQLPLCSRSGDVGVSLFVLGGTAIPARQQFQDAVITAESLRAAGGSSLVGITVDDIAAADLQSPSGSVNTSSFDCVHRVGLGSAARVHKHGGDNSTIWHVAWNIDDLPFDRTLVLKAGVGVCADVSPARIRAVLEDCDISFSYTGIKGQGSSDPWFSPSLFLVKRGAQTSSLAQTLRRLLPVGSANNAIYLALSSMASRSLRSQLLPTNWFVSLFNSLSNASGSQTLVFRDEVRIADGAFATVASVRQRCSWLNAPHFRGQPRMIVFNTATRETSIATTAEECIKRGGKHCAGVGMTWDASQVDTPATFPPAPASAVQLATLMGKRTYGVSFFGYSIDPAKVAKYIAEIEIAAWGIKLHNPGLRVCLFTNALVSPYPPFDDVVRIAEDDVKPPPSADRRGSGWNILTRVRYHVKSPYEFTIQIDSDRLVCSPLTRLFELLLTGWDFLSTSCGELPSMDHGVIAMHHGPHLHQLIQAWGDRMVERHDEGRDEQSALVDVHDSISGLRIGILEPAWQIKYTPANNGHGEVCAKNPSLCNFTHTLVAHGQVHVYAATADTLDKQEGTCNYVNAAVDRPRMLVHDVKRRTFVPVYSQQHCEEVAPGNCRHTEIAWAAPSEVTEYNEYLRLHYRQ